MSDHGDDVTSVGFSPDGTRIVSGISNRDNRLTAWAFVRFARRRCVDAGTRGGAEECSQRFWQRPRRRRVFVRGADVSTLSLVAEQPSGHSYAVKSVAFSPCGTMVVTGDMGGIKLWGERRSLACARDRGDSQCESRLRRGCVYGFAAQMH
eukprot:3729406-Prymnesium_polylepis.6